MVIKLHPDDDVPAVTEAATSIAATSIAATSIAATSRAATLADDASAPVGVERLLRRYARARSVALRNQIIDRHRGIVESMARGLASRLPRSVDAQDLVHAGMWGLMQAIANWRPERGEQFGPFMRLRVRGAMLDELRNMDFLPKLYRRRVKEREQALARLRADLGREPSAVELATELGVSMAALQRDYGAAPRQFGSAGDESGAPVMEHLAVEGDNPIEAIHRQEMLDKIKRSLQPVEWKVLQLHYLEGMTGRQVARRLRLSASRICQIHGRVLDQLKLRLAPAAV